MDRTSALDNPTGEAEDLSQAAQLYLQAEFDARDETFGNFEENLLEAIDCYGRAIEIYISADRTSLAASIRLELGKALTGLELFGEAEENFNAGRVVELMWNHPSWALEPPVPAPLTSRKDYFMELGCTEPPLPPYYRDLLGKMEVFAVLFFLLLPSALGLEHPLSGVIDRYTDVENDVPLTAHIEQEKFLAVQAVVLFFKNGDYDALCEAQTSAWHYLTPLQNEIVHFLPGKMRE